MLEEYKNCVAKALKDISVDAVKEFADIIRDTKGIVYVVGNGGSNATASHLAEDLVKAASIRAIAIDSAPLITASGNDNGYDQSFVTGLQVLLKDDDLVFGISGSGNSINILDCGLLGYNMIALLGRDGGKIGKMDWLKTKIVIPVEQMEIIEDIHMIICHLIVVELKENGANG